MPFILQLIIAAAVILAGVIFILAWLNNRRKGVAARLKLRLFSLRFPKRKKEGADMLQEIAFMERLYGAIASFKTPITFEAAVPHIGEEILFYVALPERFIDPFKKQTHSLWPDAQIEEVSEYNVFHPGGVALGGSIQQAEDYQLPVRTYEELKSDTFQSILGGLAKVGEVGEGSALQVIIKAADSSYDKGVRSRLRSLKEEAQPSAKEEEQKKKRPDDLAIKSVEEKLAKPLVEVNVRVMVSAPSDFQAKSLLEGIVAGFSQFGAPGKNSFKFTKPRNIRNLAHRFSFREFNPKERLVLNTGELASIFHFPTPFTEVPKLKFMASKSLAPPPNLPTAGTLIGESTYRGERHNVYITDDDRRRHLYIVGQTGTGKSNLLINMAKEDVEKGKGVAVIDPHGDLVEAVAGLVPPGREQDVIFFDPSSLERPIGINMLEYNFERPEEKTFIVNELISIFDKLYDLKATGGPMFEQYMRNAVLLLMEDAQNEPATLMEVPRVFTDHLWRSEKLKRINNPTVQDFWEKEAARAGGEAALSNITPYITSKFNQFTANDYMRIIVGQVHSAFNFRAVMDEGKILLVNLSKGKIGELNANLLGMIVTGKLLMAALGRVDLEESKRRDFNLFIDEFQNFTTDSIATILAEARKYRLSLTVAHQFIAQLKENIRDAVFGNVGSIVAFRVGAPDAETLKKQFEPYLEAEDLVNIDNFNAYVKLLIRGEAARPFNIKTFRAPAPDAEKILQLKELSKLKYGMPREEVEQGIYKRLRE